MSSLRSQFWEYFSVSSTDESKAVCKLCDATVSRGGKTAKTFSTSGLSSHLKNKHLEVFSKCIGQEKKRDQCESGEDAPPSKVKQAKLEQPTLKQCLGKKNCWPIDHSKAIAIHYKIGEMIALDNQPFVLVENVGFQRLMKTVEPRYKVPSRKYFCKTILPDIYSRVCNKLQLLLNEAKSISLTSDIWTCSTSNESFISLSGHWLTEEFELHSAVLHAQHFPGSHSGVNIGENLNTMLEKWKIDKKNIHLLVRDNAPNMVKGADSAEIPNEGCFIHTLQLVIKDCILTQRAVSDILGNCRKIVAHFSHSSLACGEMKKIQSDHNLPQHKLIQDIPTRWNSTYYMLERLLEQKDTISIYSANHDIPILTSQQWNVVENVIRLLQPFQELTLEASREKAAISIVIPFLATLVCYLDEEDKDAGVKTMKEKLKESVQQRFENIHTNKKYILATALDPRYKAAFFKEPTRSGVKAWLLEDIHGLKVADAPEDQVPCTSTSSQPEAEPSLREEIHKDVWQYFTKLASSSTATTERIDNLIEPSKEVDEYLATDLISRKEDPFLWWKSHLLTYPHLAAIARRYLAAPASSVYSERMFSQAGNIYDEDRNRLLPRNAEMLLFLHHNLPLKLFNYQY